LGKLRRRQASVAGSLAVVAAVVLAGFEVAGLGVHGDALSIGPVGVNDTEVIAHGVEGGQGRRREARLEVELVG